MWVSLLGVGLLHIVLWHQTVRICATRGFRHSWARSKFLEYRPIAIFVMGVVALDDGAPLALAFGVMLRELVVLLNDDAEDQLAFAQQGARSNFGT